jgi:hypothetical protein
MHGKIAGVLLTFLAVWTTAFAQRAQTAAGARQLYLVTGYARNNAFSNLDVPSALFYVDEAGSAAVLVSELSTGSNAILADHDNRMIVIDGDDLVVLSMDDPANPRHISTKSGGGNAICTQGGSKMYLCNAGLKMPGGKIGGIDLADGSGSFLPKDRSWLVRTEGFWSPGDLPGVGYIYLFPKDGKLGFAARVDGYELAIPGPPGLNRPNDIVVLDALNKDIVAFSDFEAGKGTTKAGEVEKDLIYIYDRKSGVWDSRQFDAGPVVRGFGPWLAMARAVRNRAANTPSADRLPGEAASPGAEFRQRRINNPGEKYQVLWDDMFKFVPFMFPGELYLYNTRSHRKYTIKTGQGDSEILLVDGETVYYRVNDSIFKAKIGTTAIGDPIKMVTSDDVQLAHWAFLGPRN